MTTQVEISNLALGNLGARTISSMTEATANARSCNLVYPQTRDEILREHPWGFATKIAALAVISGAEVPGWDYVYAYPSDCHFLRRIFNESTKNNEKHKILLISNQKAIVTVAEDAYAEYTCKVTNSSLFEPMFVYALAARISAKIAPAIVGDSAVAEKWLGISNGILDLAKFTNSSEGHEIPTQDTSYLDAR